MRKNDMSRSWPAGSIEKRIAEISNREVGDLLGAMLGLIRIMQLQIRLLSGDQIPEMVEEVTGE